MEMYYEIPQPLSGDLGYIDFGDGTGIRFDVAEQTNNKNCFPVDLFDAILPKLTQFANDLPDGELKSKIENVLGNENVIKALPQKTHEQVLAGLKQEDLP